MPDVGVDGSVLKRSLQKRMIYGIEKRVNVCAAGPGESARNEVAGRLEGGSPRAAGPVAMRCVGKPAVELKIETLDDCGLEDPIPHGGAVKFSFSARRAGSSKSDQGKRGVSGVEDLRSQSLNLFAPVAAEDSDCYTVTAGILGAMRDSIPCEFQVLVAENVVHLTGHGWKSSTGIRISPRSVSFGLVLCAALRRVCLRRLSRIGTQTLKVFPCRSAACLSPTF